MNHNSNRKMWIGMGIAAAVIAALSFFAGWGALALLFLICPIMMLGMMFMMGGMNHGGGNNTHKHD